MCGCRSPGYFIVPGHRQALFRERYPLHEKGVNMVGFRRPPYLHGIVNLSRRGQLVSLVTVDTQNV